MFKKTKLKKLLEDALEVLSYLKLNNTSTKVSFIDVSKLHNDLEVMYNKVRKPVKVDHSTMI